MKPDVDEAITFSYDFDYAINNWHIHIHRCLSLLRYASQKPD